MHFDQQIAFDLGWDFGIYARNVPEGANKAFCDGYRAFKKGGNKTVRSANRFERKWLQIRFGALARKKEFSSDVTPEYLEKITPRSNVCPVMLQPFTFGEGLGSDWSVDRANNDRGYMRGNIIIICTEANAAKGNKSLLEMAQNARLENGSDGLTMDQWARLAELVEPAFGPEPESCSPISMLAGQDLALGMPISPLASFQIAISRALIEGWEEEKQEMMTVYVATMSDLLCKTKQQEKAYFKLMTEILRRSRHIRKYSEIWATKRVQRRLFALVNSLGSAGLTRLVELQEATVGEENARIV